MRKIIDSNNVNLTPYMRKRFFELLPRIAVGIQSQNSKPSTPSDYTDNEEDENKLRRSSNEL